MSIQLKAGMPVEALTAVVAVNTAVALADIVVVGGITVSVEAGKLVGAAVAAAGACVA
jgi:hypothetical protein